MSATERRRSERGLKPGASPQLLIVGLDGASPSAIRQWANEGRLPVLARLMRRGVFGTLASTVPPITPIAWTTFMTGCNAGKHGIFDFMASAPGYQMPRVMCGGLRAVPTLWRLLSDAGLRVGVINMPYTFPPESLDGCMMSGFDAPDFDRRSVHPPELYEELRARFGQYSHVPVPRRGDDYDLTTVGEKTDQLADMALHVMAREPMDVVAVVFVVTDDVGHRCWERRRVRGRGEWVEDGVQHVYEQVDGAVGRLLERVGERCNVLVMSDHGMGPIRHVLNVNRVLADAGLLRFREGEGDGVSKPAGWLLKTLGRTRHLLKRVLSAEQQAFLSRRRGLLRRINWWVRASAIDWAHTRAYSASGYGLVRLNLMGREPDGQVAPGEQAHRTVDEVVEALEAVRSPRTGERLVARVMRRDELFHGPLIDGGPDLVAVPEETAACAMPEPGQSSHLSAVSDARAGWGPTILSWREGWHEPNGVLVGAGPAIACGSVNGARLMDLAPTLLRILGFKPAAHMDGRVLDEMLEPGLAEATRDLPASSVRESRRAGAEAYTSEDEKAVEQRLRDLGYL